MITPIKFSSNRILSGLLQFFVFVCVAQAQVLSVSPTQNALHVQSNASISVIFSEEINASTITSTTFRVWGAQSGFHDGTISYEAGLRKASFLSEKPFVSGEIVTVTLTNNIHTSNNQVIKPFVWNFTVSVNTSSARFPTQTEYATGKTPNSISAVDIDSDGDIDLVVAAYANTNNISILRNKGDATFLAKQDYSVEGTPRSIAAADIDGDKDIDLVLGGNKGNVSAVFVLTNNGDGTFKKKGDILGGGRTVLLADLDSDGDHDLAVTTGTTISVLINDGKGNFGMKQAYDAGSGQTSLASADLDLDGDLDLATTSTSSKKFYILKNNGNAIFLPKQEYTIVLFPSFFTMADLDRDGDIDLAIGNQYESSIYFFANSGVGTFTALKNYRVGEKPSAVIVSDFNGDQDIDIATSNLSNSVSVLENNGDATFQRVRNYPTGLQSEAVIASDLDGDLDLDLAVVNYASSTVSILLNKDEVFADKSFLRFGQIYVGTSKELSFKIYNVNANSAKVLNIISNSDRFKLTSPITLNLSPGDSTEVIVMYAPSAPMDDFGVVTIYSAGLAIERVSLQGTGIAAVPIMSTDPSDLDFGNVTLNKVSDLILSITNKGASDLNITGIASVNSYFTVKGGTVQTIFPNQTKFIIVQFSPPFLGAQSDTLRIHSNDTNSNVTQIPMAGAGVSAGIQEISIWPTELNFESVGVTQTKHLTLYVYNWGAANLSIHGTESNNDVFVIESSSSFMVAPGDSQVVSISFNPRGVGLQTGALTFMNNDSNENPLVIYMNGVGVDHATPSLTRFFPSTGVRRQTLDVTFIGSNFVSGITSINAGPDIIVNRVTVYQTDSLIANLTIGQKATRGTRDFSVSILTKGSTSNALPFTILNQTPSRPGLLAPADNDSLWLYRPPRPISFTWNQSYDADLDDTLRYEIRLKGPGLNKSATVIRDTSFAWDIMSSLQDFTTYTWTVNVKYGSAVAASLDTFSLRTLGFASAVGHNPDLAPTEYRLKQNYPNPFNPTTVIPYQLPRSEWVTLKIYDVFGREIVTLVNEKQPAGYYNVEFTGESWASGVYVYRLTAGTFREIRKFLLIK